MLVMAVLSNKASNLIQKHFFAPGCFVLSKSCFHYLYVMRISINTSSIRLDQSSRNSAAFRQLFVSNGVLDLLPVALNAAHVSQEILKLPHMVPLLVLTLFLPHNLQFVIICHECYVDIFEQKVYWNDWYVCRNGIIMIKNERTGKYAVVELRIIINFIVGRPVCTLYHLAVWSLINFIFKIKKCSFWSKETTPKEL